MYFLIWIYETCQPGRMYGPLELLECDNKMREYAQEAIKTGEQLNEYKEEYWYVNSESGQGWYIVKSEEE